MPVDSATRQPLQPQRVLDALPTSAIRAINPTELAALLKLHHSQLEVLRDYLRRFASSGLVNSKAGRYWRPRSDRLLGELRGTRSGHAFVVPSDPRERQRGDVYISSRSLGSALHGDRVIARIVGTTRKGREGQIEEVLERAHGLVVGRFTRDHRVCFVAPSDERFMYEIRVAPASTGGAIDGDIVSVEITTPPASGRPPWGRIVEVIGREDAPGIDLLIVIRKHRLPERFDPRAIEEAEAIAETVSAAQIEDRLDQRGELTITIDGETARDFDDAVSLRPLPSGRLQLGVHIADVSHYVREASALDEGAFIRGTSVYFSERAIPMLPERLSNGICSLNPGVDRLTMSVLLEMDPRGRIIDYRIAPSAIRSRERMTYTAVNEILQDPASPAAAQYPHVVEMLLGMRQLAVELIKRREQRGAIDFDLPEAELLFNDEGQIGGIARAERNFAHRLIEEFMLLANETVAAHLDSLGVPLLFRIHEEPNPAKVEEFADIAASFGHKFSMHGPIPQRGFQHLARQIEGRPEERMLSYLMLRSMQRARYAAQNSGHFGLAMKTYTHFTSPIRRYPDLIVHRILNELLRTEPGLGLRRALKTGPQSVHPEERETELRRNLELIADHSSERERAAADAERELMDWRRAEFMATRTGEEFEGVISGVREYGFYVELNEVFVEGLVHTSTLNDDRYEFQERKHRLVGERRGRAFRLGDIVRVIVLRVDRVRHRIDFALA